MSIDLPCCLWNAEALKVGPLTLVGSVPFVAIHPLTFYCKENVCFQDVTVITAWKLPQTFMGCSINGLRFEREANACMANCILTWDVMRFYPYIRLWLTLLLLFHFCSVISPTVWSMYREVHNKWLKVFQWSSANPFLYINELVVKTQWNIGVSADHLTQLNTAVPSASVPRNWLTFHRRPTPQDLQKRALCSVQRLRKRALPFFSYITVHMYPLLMSLSLDFRFGR